jgi:uncharacterized BrkB/YihY/UPF0761 family membrane protein
VDFYLLKVHMFKVPKNLPSLVKLTDQGWKEDNGSRLAAALTYYTVFPLALMLIIAIAVAGLIWQQAVQDQVLSQIQGLAGEQGRTFVAGSLVFLLLRVNYSAQILFFGAEFTQVYANQLGSRIIPEGQKATTSPTSTSPPRSTGVAYPVVNSGRQTIPATSGPS